MTAPLHQRQCQRLTRDDPALSQSAAESLLKQLHPDWRIDWNGPVIQRDFKFRDYYQTIAFVNALAWVAHREDHHPDLSVSYNRCTVRYNTHVIGGLSDNDFICAAKLDALVVDGQ